MIAREIQAQDYEVVTEWWKRHEWPVLAPNFLPDLGVMVCDDNGRQLCVEYLYLSNGTDIAWAEWLTINPDLDKETRNKAIQLCIKSISDIADEAGLVLFTSIKNDKLKSRLLENGYVVSDERMTNMIYRGIKK